MAGWQQNCEKAGSERGYRPAADGLWFQNAFAQATTKLHMCFFFCDNCASHSYHFNSGIHTSYRYPGYDIFFVQWYLFTRCMSTYDNMSCILEFRQRQTWLNYLHVQSTHVFVHIDVWMIMFKWKSIFYFIPVYYIYIYIYIPYIQKCLLVSILLTWVLRGAGCLGWGFSGAKERSSAGQGDTDVVLALWSMLKAPFWVRLNVMLEG